MPAAAAVETDDSIADEPANAIDTQDQTALRVPVCRRRNPQANFAQSLAVVLSGSGILENSACFFITSAKECFKNGRSTRRKRADLSKRRHGLLGSKNQVRPIIIITSKCRDVYRDLPRGSIQLQMV